MSVCLEILQNFEKFFPVVNCLLLDVGPLSSVGPGRRLLLSARQFSFLRQNSKTTTVETRNMYLNFEKKSREIVIEKCKESKRTACTSEVLRSVDHSPKFKTRKIQIGSECFM